MKNIPQYLDFLKEKGKPLSGINPGSDEIALPIEDALEAVKLLTNSKVVILGGDILSEKNNSLIYAYQLWGEEYSCLSWYCNKLENENENEYLHRSHVLAKQNIINSNKVASSLKEKCYVVFVIP